MISGQKIRALRKQLGLSQVALGAQAGVSGPYISFLESAQRGTRPSYGFVQALAAALGVEPAHLLAT